MKFGRNLSGHYSHQIICKFFVSQLKNVPKLWLKILVTKQWFHKNLIWLVPGKVSNECNSFNSLYWAGNSREVVWSCNHFFLKHFGVLVTGPLSRYDNQEMDSYFGKSENLIQFQGEFKPCLLILFLMPFNYYTTL